MKEPPLAQLSVGNVNNETRRGFSFFFLPTLVRRCAAVLWL